MRRVFLALSAALAGCGGPLQDTAPSETPPPAPASAPESPPAPTPAAPSAKADPSLPSRAAFAGNPDYLTPRVSPNGKWLAYIAPFEGVLNVYVAPFDAPEKAEPLTRLKGRPVRQAFWAKDNAHVLYLNDVGGDENFHVFAVDLKTKTSRDLTDLPKTKASPLKASAKRPNEILVALNDRDPKFFDVHRIDLKTGKRTLVFKNEQGLTGFTADDDLQVRLAEKQTPDGGSELFEVTKNGQLKPFAKVGMEDALTTAALAFDTTGKTLYMIDSRGRNTAAATAYDFTKKASKVLAEDPRADIQEALLHPKTGRILAVSSSYDRKQWKVIDKSVAPDFAKLDAELKGDFGVIEQSDDGRFWTVVEDLDAGSPKFYTYDQKTKALKFLAHARKDLEGQKLASMLPRVLKARDGLDLVSYLSLPVASDPDGDGKPSAPVPMVLLVHGGPWARDTWGYGANVQWLASRGYAVLQVNFRGSTGFGKNFINAANGEWGAKMHDDLVDAVKWAIDSGIADAQKVAIYGGSYGGYSVLVGLTKTPETFACGVDLVGPSSLQTLLETIPPYWEPVIDMFTKRIGGDHRTEEGRKFLAERSPLHDIDAIKRPLLIGQGANDPRVKQSESDQIVRAMTEKKIPVTYVLFPDEGHGFARPENRLAFNAVSEAFLAGCLGGPYQPVGNDFQGSTITVPVGAEAVAGLPEALKTVPTSGVASAR